MSKDVIQFSMLGNHGRFGNCIMQSAMLQTYAAIHDLCIEAPEFPGQEIFSFKFDPVTQRLPVYMERLTNPADGQSEQLPPIGAEAVNHDYRGYGQFHTSWYRPWHEELQNMFGILRPKEKDFTAVGMHFRQGDYVNKGFHWRAPHRWYQDWIDENWGRLDKPELHIVAEDGYSPYFSVAETLPAPGGARSFTLDWAVLSLCDIVLMPNSTFSFTAAWLNPNLKEAWRASLPDGKFVRFDPWDSTPMLYDKAEHYAGLLDPL